MSTDSTTLRSSPSPTSLASDEYTPERKIFSLSDADVLLQSIDGTTFQVDPAVLRLASPFFAHMFRLPRFYHLEPYLMQESGAVLNDIFRSVFPPVIVETLSSIEHAIALLRAVRRLKISNIPLSNSITQYIGNIDPPIRAWAIAIDIDHIEARKIAVKRFICDGKSVFEQYHLDDLNRTNVTSLLKLGWLREHVRENTLTEKDFPVMWCNRMHGVEADEMRAIAPAGCLLPTEEVLQIFIKGTRCRSCLAGLRNEVHIAARRKIRTSVEGLLKHTACMENGTLKMDGKHWPACAVFS